MPEWLLFILALIPATFRLTVPILLASIGEVISERAGVMNIGIEGYMLMGALFGYIGSLWSGSPLVGVMLAVIVGGLLSLIHAFLSVTCGVEQIISGIGLWIFSDGFTGFINRTFVIKGSSIAPTAKGFGKLNIPMLSEIPVVGPILFEQNAFFYASIFLAIAFNFILFRTNFGLKIRAVGEKPAAIMDAGVSVNLMRYIGILICGAMGGLAGASLSLGIMDRFFEGMSSGKGFIALAIVVLGNWMPINTIWGSLLFAVMLALQLRLQALGVAFPYPFLLMLPYVLAIVAVAGVIKKANTPAALGEVYRAE